MGHNELEGLSSFHLDVIRETVNIGAGNAATALSQLVGSAVTMDVPKAELVSIYELADRYTSPTKIVSAVYLRFEGEFSGNMLWIMSDDIAKELVRMLIAKDFGDLSQDQMDQIADSLLVEVGNIVLSSFLNAISAMINCPLPSSLQSLSSYSLHFGTDHLYHHDPMFGVKFNATTLIATYITPDQRYAKII
jgi:chemotaxis protein CheC